MRSIFLFLMIWTGGFNVSELGSLSQYVENSSSDTTEIKLSSEKCEKESNVWNDTAALKLDSICDTLSYEFKTDYCFIEEDEKLECLRDRALMHDMKSCQCFRQNSRHRHCIFVEVCLFTAPDFVCDNSYSCTVNDSNHAVNCVSSKGQPSVKSFCNSSFIHSTPENEQLCSMPSFPAYFRKVFKDLCLTENTTFLMGSSTWYYLDRVHFNNSAFTFAGLAPILLAENDKDNKCIKKDNLCDLTMDKIDDETAPWKIAIPTLAIFITFIAICFAIIKCRTRYLKEEGEWKEFMEKSIQSSIFETSPAKEPHQRSPEVTSTNICPSSISEDETDTNDASQSSLNETECAGQTGLNIDGYERLAAGEGHTSVNTATACNNPSYQIQRPIEFESILGVNLGEYSAPSAEIVNVNLISPGTESFWYSSPHPAPNSGQYSSQ